MPRLTVCASARALFAPHAIPAASMRRLLTRSLTSNPHTLYAAHATATGAGRNGDVVSGNLSLKLATPTAMGGSGAGQNPEQLFAMGYAGCFLGALQHMATVQGKEAMGKVAVVHTSVQLNKAVTNEGFGLAVNIEVEGIDQALLDATHEFCPYSRALGNGAPVTVALKK